MRSGRISKRIAWRAGTGAATWGAAALALVIGLTAAEARGQQTDEASASPSGPGDDEVTLKDGGTLRGTVVSLKPGTEVQILLVGKSQPETVPWAEVADVQRGKYAVQPSASATPPASPGYGTAPAVDSVAGTSGGDTVDVHIQSDEPVQLYEHLGSSIAAGGGYVVGIAHTRSVCSNPCDRRVDGSRGQQFVIAGDGVPASDPFRLDASSGQSLDIEVDAGSTGAIVGGAQMILWGGIGALTGGTLLVTGAVVDAGSTSEDVTLAGGITLGASSALLVGGIVLVAMSGTDVDIRPRKRDTASRTAPAEPRAPRYWMGEF